MSLWPLCLCVSVPFVVVEQTFDIGILISHNTVRVGCWPISAVQVVSECSEIRGQLPAMMRRMGNTAYENPRACAFDVEEVNLFFKPRFRHGLQFFHSLP